MEELNSLPFVSEVYKNHLNYRDYFYAHSRYPIITLITGRGMPLPLCILPVSTDIQWS